MKPLRIALDVACPPAHAFEVFTARATTWWPARHTMSGEPGLEVVFEPEPGGRIFERRTDGGETDWGRVLVWEPPTRLVFSWHMRADAADATEVEIAFRPEASGTRVELEHRGFERLGERGPGWRERNRGGWDGLLPHFAAACAAVDVA